MSKEPFSFASWLEEFAHGTTHKIASERMQEIVKACEETGRKGSLTIKIDIGVVAEVRANVTVKKPERPMPGATYYATTEGELVSEDPRQLSLPAPRVIDPAPVRMIHVHHNPNPSPAPIAVDDPTSK